MTTRGGLAPPRHCEDARVSNEVTTPPKTLQERVGERIREQIGDLLTADDLAKLVDTAMTEAFFTPRRERRPYGEDILHPPLIVGLVQKLMQEQVQAAATAWLEAHSDEVKALIDDAIGRGFTGIVQRWMDQQMQSHLFAFGQQLQNTLNLPR